MNNLLHPLGKIVKTHGYSGMLMLVSNDILDEESETLKKIFVVVDGLSVPFQVEELTLLTGTSAYLKLEFIDTKEEAFKFVNYEVSSEIVSQEPNTDTSLEQLIGFAIYDVRHGNIGIIRRVEDYKGNIVLQVMDGEKETLISLFPELVTNINENAKTIHIVAPDGYFDEKSL